MKSLLKALSVTALIGAAIMPALAQTAPTPTTPATDQKDLKQVVTDESINFVQTAQKGITLSGYVDTSYTEQFAGRENPFTQPGFTPNGSNPGGVNPLTGTINKSTANLRQFDGTNDGFNLNAVKLALEQALPDKNEWAAGFRVDLMAGSDAANLSPTDPALSSSGHYGVSNDLFIEQALVKFRIPIGNGLDIYAGKFVTFLGYEVIESPANLNFSRGLLFTNAIPLTNTGVYADYKFSSMVEAKLAVVDGWNDSSSTASSDPNASYVFGGKSIMGQINVTAPGNNANLCSSFIYTPDGGNMYTSATGPYNAGIAPNTVGGFGDNGTVFVYDLWGNWNPTFVKDSALTLGFNGDFGYNGAAGIAEPNPAAGGAATTWYGVALYSSYKFTKVFTLSGRLEWLGESSAVGGRLGPVSPGLYYGQKFPGTGGSTNDYEATLTASFSIWDNLLTRAEYRHDFLEGTSYNSQNEVSLEAVYSF
jgi:hypothetical protein